MRVIERREISDNTLFSDSHPRKGDVLRVKQGGGTLSAPHGTEGVVTKDHLVTSESDPVTVRTSAGILLTQSYLHYELVTAARASRGLNL